MRSRSPMALLAILFSIALLAVACGSDQDGADDAARPAPPRRPMLTMTIQQPMSRTQSQRRRASQRMRRRLAPPKSPQLQSCGSACSLHLTPACQSRPMMLQSL